GSFSSSSRGHASGPIKQLFAELKRRCCTRLVSEFRTSQIYISTTLLCFESLQIELSNSLE
ncbi:12014_t:CDS:2, partial [Funneliformis geosporum]